MTFIDKKIRGQNQNQNMIKKFFGEENNEYIWGK